MRFQNLGTDFARDTKVLGGQLFITLVNNATLKGWRDDYKADPHKMLGNVTKSQVLGSEMVLWTKLVSISYG